jgi:hypothetical protein
MGDADKSPGHRDLGFESMQCPFNQKDRSSVIVRDFEVLPVGLVGPSFPECLQGCFLRSENSREAPVGICLPSAVLPLAGSEHALNPRRAAGINLCLPFVDIDNIKANTSNHLVARMKPSLAVHGSAN